MRIHYDTSSLIRKPKQSTLQQNNGSPSSNGIVRGDDNRQSSSLAINKHDNISS